MKRINKKFPPIYFINLSKTKNEKHPKKKHFPHQGLSWCLWSPASKKGKKVKKVNPFFFREGGSDKTNEPGNNKSGQMTFGDLAPEMVTKGK